MADPKQKRKKGTFTKLGGDKEVLFHFKNVHLILVLFSIPICIQYMNYLRCLNITIVDFANYKH